MIVASGLLAGCCCLPESSPTRDVVVQPIKGVWGLCEIGMSLTEVRNRNQTITCEPEWSGVRYIIVPALAAEVPIIETNQTVVTQITFHVVPYQRPDGNMRLNAPFRGRLGTDLCFSKRAINISEVMKVYGHPVVTKLHPPSLTYEDVEKAWQVNTMLLTTTEFSTLHYFDRGLSFHVISNLVTSFTISTPRASRTNHLSATSDLQRALDAQ